MGLMHLCLGDPMTNEPCYRLTRTTRCEQHTGRLGGTTTQRGYGTEHQRIRARLLATATRCHWCGKPFTPSDPMVADHVKPYSQGGRSDAANLVAAHRSCNARRRGE
jgi:5-methylcytosine-specific restriction endonuclease McrA